MKITIKSVAVLILALASMSVAQGKSKIVSAKPDGGSYLQYKMNEWTVTLNGQWKDDPYDQDQIALDLHFTGADGVERVLPCYYVSGNSGKKSTWKARFAPLALGENKLTFVLSEGGAKVAEYACKSIKVGPSNAHGVLHPNDNWTFKYDDGTLFRGVGENICWELRGGEGKKFEREYGDDGSRFNYGYMLHKLASLGGNFYRVWFTSNLSRGDFKRPEPKNGQRPEMKPGQEPGQRPEMRPEMRPEQRPEMPKSEFSEAMMSKMDYMVRLSDSLDVHMMLAMDVHGSFLDGGWERNRYNVKNGGPAKDQIDFFASAECRRMYKNKFRFLIARYAYSPAIGCWEFFNEVDNAMYNGSVQIPQDVVMDWHREMSEYIKATDPYNHLVTTSISHRDVAGMNSIPTMDFNQKHIYCNTDKIPATIREYETLYGKPYVIGEEGYHWDWNLDFNTMVPGLIHDYKYALWLGMFSPTPILPMSWWWEFFEYHGTYDYIAIVSKMSRMMMEAADGDFSCVDCAGSAESTALAVRAGKKIFVYIHNNNDSDFTAGYSISVPEGGYAIECFDTKTGQTSALGGASSNDLDLLYLPKANLGPMEDVIYIVSPAE